jgi:hypothetical protein
LAPDLIWSIFGVWATTTGLAFFTPVFGNVDAPVA